MMGARILMMLKVFIVVVLFGVVGYAVVVVVSRTTTTNSEVEFGNAGWEDERRRAVRSEAEFGVPGAVVDHDRRAVVVVVIRAAHFILERERERERPDSREVLCVRIFGKQIEPKKIGLEDFAVYAYS